MKKIVMILMMVLVLSSLSFAGGITEFDSSSDVAIDKVWTISFNKDVAESDIEKIEITKEKMPIEINTSFTDDKITITPVNNYEYYVEYVINIQLKNGNQYLKNFTTMNNSDIFEYTIADNEVTITNYIGDSMDIIIPEKIDGFLVTGIGEYAFGSGGVGFGTGITSISIPDSVTTIGAAAFGMCSLKELILPKSLTSLGVSFAGYNMFDIIVIPEGLTEIGPWTFSDTGVNQVVIPSTVTKIGHNAFEYSGLESIDIPDSVTYIGEEAFMSNYFLEVEIPRGCSYQENSFDSDVRIIEK